MAIEDYYCLDCGFNHEMHDSKGRCPTDDKWNREAKAAKKKREKG